MPFALIALTLLTHAQLCLKNLAPVHGKNYKAMASASCIITGKSLGLTLLNKYTLFAQAQAPLPLQLLVFDMQYQNSGAMLQCKKILFW